MKKLYPLKFEPILIETIWGGQNLRNLLNKKIPDNKKIGETLEIVQLEDLQSVVKNGFLAGNTLADLMEIYMNDLVGDQVYLKYGIEFPLLFKFLDAQEKLSIQVHPDNDTAYFRHNAYGKTEMWYVLDAKPGAQIVLGFNQDFDKYSLLKALDEKNLIKYLNIFEIQKGDVIYIPSGTIHALLGGAVVAEIQQNSDITYRLYDWDRVDENGKSRKLHVDLAVDVINYSKQTKNKINYELIPNKRVELIANPYFTTNLIVFDRELEFDYSRLDSFVVYMCLEGSFKIKSNTYEYEVDANVGDTILLPAEAEEVFLIPNENSKILETYIPFVYVEKP